MARSLLVPSLLLAIGCGGGAGDLDAGHQRPDATTRPVDAGEPPEDAGSPDVEDAGSTPDGGATESGSIAWSSELENPYELTLDAEIALDYFLQYSVVLPEPNFPPATVRVTICQHPASAAEETCTHSDSTASEGGGLRYGIDPSSYDEGLNLYTFTARLYGGDGELIDEDVLRWRITYAPSGT